MTGLDPGTGQRRGLGSSRGSADLLIHPLFTGALAVLAVNDHVLKAVWPGLISGKLSDFSGVVVVALALHVVCRQATVSVVATGVAFVALKTVPGVAEEAAVILGGVTRRDPADLVALAGLWPLQRWLARRPSDRRPAAACAAAERRWLTPARIALTGLTVVGVWATVTATSCYQDGIVDVRAIDGSFWLSTGPDGVRPMESLDAGLTWEERPVAGDPPVAPPAAGSATEACAPNGDCFVLNDHEVRRVGADGIEEVDFAFTTDQRRRLDVAVDGVCNGAPRFNSVAVLDTDRGAVVIVGMGFDGLLRRAPDGRWSRLEVAGFAPRPFGLPMWTRWLALTAAGLIVGAPLLLLLRRRHLRRRAVAAAWTAVSCGFALGLVGLTAQSPVVAGDPRPMGIAIAMISVVVFAGSLALAFTTKPVAPTVLDGAPGPDVPPVGGRSPASESSPAGD